MPARRTDLNLIIVLDAVLQTRSVTQAARRVGITKTAMSHALSRVRRELRDPVLVRVGKEWTLTDRARKIAERVHDVALSANELLCAPAPFEADTAEREFRIRITDHGLFVLGIDLCRAAEQEAPGIRLCFTPALPDDSTALQDGGVDVAIGVFPTLPASFRMQRLFEERYACVVRADHPVRRLSVKRYATMDHVLIAPRGRPVGPVDTALRARGLTRRVPRSVPYFLPALELVAKTDAICTLSDRLARAYATRFGLRVVAPPLALPSYSIVQVWHPRADMDTGHVWLRQLIARVARSSEPATR
jgi:DNA-binding transcriptional LysR family regulator